MYYNISVDRSNQIFSLAVVDKRADKSHSAKTTLNQIHDIMRENLQYNGEDEQPNPKDIANRICANYLAKTEKMSGIRRFFGRVSKKENEIKEINQRIQNYVHESHLLERGDQPFEMEIAGEGSFPVIKPILQEGRSPPQKNPPMTIMDLASELIANICQYLSWSDLDALEKTNRVFFKETLLYPRLLIARTYGFDDSKENGIDKKLKAAKICFDKEKKIIKFLAESDLIPERYVVRNHAVAVAGMRLFPRIDADRMLDKVRRLMPAKREEFVAYLNTSLATCIEQNRIAKGIALIREGANPKIRDESGLTLLHKAALCRCVKMIPEIIDAGVDINAQTNEGNTALLLAVGGSILLAVGRRRDLVESPDYSLIKTLLKNGANPNIANNADILPLKGAFSRTFRPDVEKLLEMLCSYGADINHPTLVQNIFVSGFVYSEILKKSGFNWLTRDVNENTFLMYLINMGRYYSADVILNHDNSSVNVICNNQLPLNESLRCFAGFTVHSSSYYECARVIFKLLNKGANVNAIDNGVDYPVHIAIRIDSHFLRVLLDHGADPNQETHDGRDTPLTLALRRSLNGERVEVLLKRGAEVNRAPSQGSTPLAVVLRELVAGNYLSARLLRNFYLLCNHGVDLNAPCMRSYPLHIAAAYSESLTRLFLNHGADPTILDAAGKTALDNALPRCRKLLERRLSRS